MRRTAMREPPERSVSAWLPPDRAPPIWSLVSPPHTWILFPIVAITANVTVPLLGRDSFQEVDIAGVTMPITKHNFIVKDVTELADTMRRAFFIAQERPSRSCPGGYHERRDAAVTEYDPCRSPARICGATEYIRDEDLETAAEMINKSEAPFLYVGGGAIISNASEEVRAFGSQDQRSRVAIRLMGKGAFDGRDELYMRHDRYAWHKGFQLRCDRL